MDFTLYSWGFPSLTNIKSYLMYHFNTGWVKSPQTVSTTAKYIEISDKKDQHFWIIRTSFLVPYVCLEMSWTPVHPSLSIVYLWRWGSWAGPHTWISLCSSLAHGSLVPPADKNIYDFYWSAPHRRKPLGRDKGRMGACTLILLMPRCQY